MQFPEFLPKEIRRRPSIGLSVDERKQHFLVCAQHGGQLGGQLGERLRGAGGLGDRTVHGIVIWDCLGGESGVLRSGK